MFDERKQGHGGKIVDDRRRNGEEQGARGRLGQWQAGAVVGLDAPAQQVRRHARRKVTIRRYQGGRPVRHFDRFP